MLTRVVPEASLHQFQLRFLNRIQTLFYPCLQRVRHILTTEAQTNIRQQQSSWSQRCNRNRRNMHHRIGDLVYVSVADGQSKLDPRHNGLYTVIETSGQQHYLVRGNDRDQTDWCHVNQLRPSVRRSSIYTS